jgi:hypothetical protein
MTVPAEMAAQTTTRGRLTFEQNIRGHAFNALTASLGSDPWLPLSRRKEIADAIGDAILAFLAPLGLNGAVWQPEAREIPLRRRDLAEARAFILASGLPPDLKALLADEMGPET